MVKVKIELSGGLEILFGNSKEHDLEISQANGKVTIADVIVKARDDLLTDRPELFMKDDSVRPGILVLVNDTDWELTGTLHTLVEDGDTVTFISTLHGG
ncbi:Ubiquitin-related modifier 1 homolog [Coccomyxa sp. Obi]|nr:Ubiquitin-related modifier 1 homolog [Coccomyxa sp. Obi]